MKKILIAVIVMVCMISILCFRYSVHDVTITNNETGVIDKNTFGDNIEALAVDKNNSFMEMSTKDSSNTAYDNPKDDTTNKNNVEIPTDEEIEIWKKDGSWEERVAFNESLPHDVSPNLIKNLQIDGLGTDVELGDVKGITTSMPSTGNVKTLVITCDFEGERFNEIIRSRINRWFNGEEDKTSWYYPYESLSAYYKRSSFGKLNLSSEIWDYHSSYNRQYYEQDYDILINELLEAYCDSVKATCDGTGQDKENYLNNYLSNYDTDSDGNIDGIYFVLSGKNTGWGSFLWPHVGYYNGFKLGEYSLGSTCILMEDLMSDDVTTAIHETGHMLGLPDYYDYHWGIPMLNVGTFDVMAGYSGDHNGFSKMLLGWIDDDNITIIKDKTTVTESLASYSGSGDMVLIVPDWDDVKGLYNEFYMLEYFKSEENDTLKAIEDKNALRIYHINANLNDSKTDFIAENIQYNEGKIPLVQGMDKDQMNHEVVSNSSDIAFGTINNYPNDYNCFYYNGDEFTPYTCPSSYLYKNNTNRFQKGYYSGLFIDNIDITDDSVSFRVGYELEQTDKKLEYEIIENTEGTYTSNHKVRLRMNQEIWLACGEGETSEAYITNENGDKVCDITLQLSSASLSYLHSVYSDVFVKGFNNDVVGDEKYTIVIPQGTIVAATGVYNDKWEITFDNRKEVSEDETIAISKKYWKNEWGACVDGNGNGGIVIANSEGTTGEYDIQYYPVHNMYVSMPVKLEITGVLEEISVCGVQQLVDNGDDYLTLVLYFDKYDDYYSKGKYIDIVVFEKQTGNIINERELVVDTKYKSGIMDDKYAVMHGTQIELYDFMDSSEDETRTVEQGVEELDESNTNYKIRKLNDDHFMVCNSWREWYVFDEEGNTIEFEKSGKTLRGIEYYDGQYYVLSYKSKGSGLNIQNSPVIRVYNDDYRLIEEYEIDVWSECRPDRLIRIGEEYVLYWEAVVGYSVDSPVLIYLDENFNVKSVVVGLNSRTLSVGDGVLYSIGKGQTESDIKGAILDFSSVTIPSDDNNIVIPQSVELNNNTLVLSEHKKQNDFAKLFEQYNYDVLFDNDNVYIQEDNIISIGYKDGRHTKYINVVFDDDIEHIYSDWKSDGEDSDLETHSKKCVVCDARISEKHNWDEGVVTQNASCTENGIKTYTCKKCGATKDEPIEKSKHIITRIDATSATCETEGNIEYWVCEGCGKLFADSEGNEEINAEDVVVAKKEHTPKEAVKEKEVAATCEKTGSYDEVIYCSVCGTEISRNKIKVDALGHDCGNWSVITPATENTTGKEIRVCKREGCTHSETREIPELTHTHVLMKHDATSATCETEGNIEYWVCEGCGKLFADSEGNEEINAEDVVVAKKEHTPKEAVKEKEVAATCEKTGSYDEVIYCSVCGTEISRNKIKVDALGHDCGNWSVITPATENTTGKETRVCKREGCTHSETREIPELTHTHVLMKHDATSATCEIEGNIEYWVCEGCGKLFADSEGNEEINAEDVVVTKQAHTPKEAVKEKEVAATCEKAGSYDEVVYCTVCGTEISRVYRTISSLGHDYGKPVYEWSADGKKCRAKVTCKRESCNAEVEGYTVTEMVDSTSSVKVDSTTEKKGVTTYKATFINRLFTEQTKDIEDIPVKQKEKNLTATASQTMPISVSSDVKVEGTILTAQDIMAEVIVTSKEGEKPSVEYKTSTDKYTKETVIPVTVTVEGVSYEVTSVAEDAFKDNKIVQTVTIPKTVTEIGDNAFAGCTSLKTVELPDSIAEIGDGAFSGCKALNSIAIPERVEEIGNNIFNGCTSLKKVSIPNSVKEIGDGAFNGCSSLKKLSIPDSVTEIGQNAFNGCKKLTSMNVGKNVKKVGDGAFANCTSMRTVTLSTKTNTLGKQVFKGNKNLKTINIKSKKLTSKSLAKNAFKGIGDKVTIKVPKGKRDAYTELFRKKGLSKKVRIR